MHSLKLRKRGIFGFDTVTSIVLIIIVTLMIIFLIVPLLTGTEAPLTNFFKTIFGQR